MADYTIEVSVPNVGPAGPEATVPPPAYASAGAAVDAGKPFGGLYRNTDGTVGWIEEVDPDVQTYLDLTGATARWAIQSFVVGVKALGLWNNMVCWPLRPSQNKATGLTIYSLGGGGSFPGQSERAEFGGGGSIQPVTPTWTSTGLTVATVRQKISTTYNFASGLVSIFAVVRPNSGAQGSGERFMGNDEGGNSDGISFDDFAPDAFRLLAANLANVGTRTANTRTFFGHGYGTDNTFWFQDGSRTARSNTAYNAATTTMCPVGGPNFAVGTAFGEYSFSVAFDNVVMTSELLTSFYALYKTTLGTGLTLP
jgi:hypothetical protein